MVDAGSLDQAIDQYQIILASYPGSKYAIQARLDIAFNLYKRKKYTRAIVELNKFIEKYPDLPSTPYAYYLKGVVLSFIELESYLKIFLTSFLGVFTFKVIFSTLGYDSLIHILERLNLPIQDEDFVNYLVEIQKVSYLKILLVLLIFFYISKRYIVDLKKE